MLIAVSFSCTLIAVGFAHWQNGNARAWQEHADAAEARARALHAMLMRVPRQPVLTVVAPEYHAPLARDSAVR